jgi:hypothetical protein
LGFKEAPKNITFFPRVLHKNSTKVSTPVCGEIKVTTHV